MPRLDYTTDDQADDRLNPVSDLGRAENDNSSQIEPSDGSSVNELEKEAGDDSVSSINYKPSQKTNKNNKEVGRKLVGALRGRLGVISLLTTFGVGAGLLITFFGPASMLINVAQNIGLTNDTSSLSLERRLYRVLNKTMNLNSNASTFKICASSNKIKCKMGQISKKSLRRFAKAGAIAMNGSSPVDIKGSGIAKQRITSFRVSGHGDIKPNELLDFLKKPGNEKMARGILGRKGVLRMRVNAWNGKAISQKLYSKFRITRAGGMINKANANIKDYRSKIKNNTLSKLNNISGRLSDKTTKRVAKAGRAGPAYTIGLAGCYLMKAPSLIASGIAAFQLAQILPMVMDYSLSPGSSLMAAGEPGNPINPEDVDRSATLLTENHPSPNDGKMKSALDSKYLLAAMGVSGGKLPMSKFIPGYSAMNNPLIKTGAGLDEASKPACNVIMSSQAMATAMAVDAATTVALSSTVVLGIVKVAASWAISAVAAAVAGMVVSDLAETAIEKLVDSDMIPSAVGEELGDVIGIGATAFFASGGLARGLSPLSMRSVSAFNDIRHEEEEFQKRLDVESLSPFDTSSPHTLMGSISNNLSKLMIKGAGPNYTFASTISNLIRLPAMALSFQSTANAATVFSADYCGYANEFGLDTGDPSTTPGITISGLPCTGITSTQDTMETDEAIDLLHNEGWIDLNADAPDGATIDDLLSTGFIKPDNPLADFIEECTDSSTGDYLFNSTGCMVSGEHGSAGSTDSSKIEGLCTDVKSEEDGPVVNKCITDEYSQGEIESNTTGFKNPKSMSAITVFLLDYSVSMMLRDEDNEAHIEATESIQPENVNSHIDTPSKEGWSRPIPGVKPGFGYRQMGSKGLHKGVDWPAPKGTPVYSVRDGNVTLVRNMGSCGWATVISAAGIPGLWHAYQHMDPIVRIGDSIKRGQKIGEVGKFCGTGHHLHFSIETANRVSAYSDSGSNDTSRDPMKYLP